MNRMAFYAPMKPPDHPIPSGDREMARNLMSAMSYAGSDVNLVSRHRIYDGTGDADLQGRLQTGADAEIARLNTALADSPPDAWITYHNYYKAPDLIGPAVCAALDIPYVLIEASRAKSRLNGPWANFATAAEAASDSADLIFYLTDQDREALFRDKPDHQRLARLKPFLPFSELRSYHTRSKISPILTVGMMRPGDKLASYTLIAQTLEQVEQGSWHLDIAGDGPARAEVERLMSPFGDRVRFLGELNTDQLAAAYARSRLLFWPGVNEAFGMVYLEAQATGLPIVAQDRPGLRDVLAPGAYPEVASGSRGLARALQNMLSDSTDCTTRGKAAREYIAAHHLLPQAAQTLARDITAVIEARA